MIRGSLENKNGCIQLLVWLALLCVCTLVAVGVWQVACGDRVSTTGLKWFQALQTTGTLLLPPLLVAYLWSTQPLNWLQLNHRPQGRVLGLSIILMLVASPGINLIGYWNEQLSLPDCLAGVEAWMKAQEQAAAVLTERFIAADNIGILLINIVLMALLPALSEELTFRGVLQGLMNSHARTPHIAIWVTAMLFSAVHCQFYGFIPRMLMGALLGYTLVWTGNMWIPITMHFINNATAVIGYYVVQKMAWDTAALETFGTGSTLWVGILSLVLVGIGIIIMRRVKEHPSE